MKFLEIAAQMNTNSQHETDGRCRTVSSFCGLVSLLMGASVLVGWIFDIAALKSILPGVVSMKANTALCFVSAGSALMLLSALHGSAVRRRVGKLLGWAVTVVGLLSFSEYLFRLNLGIDELIFVDNTAGVATSHAGRMAISTALSFILAGLALAWIELETRWGLRPSEILALVPLVLGVFSLIEYGLGFPILFEFGNYTRMAIHSAGGFCILSLGLLLARPSQGLIGSFRRSTAGAGERGIYVVAGILVFLLLGAGGWFFNAERYALERQAKNLLSTVALEKVKQINNWREERLADARLLSDSPFLRATIPFWLELPTKETTDDMLSLLASFKKRYDYEDIQLLSPDGQVRLSLQGTTETGCSLSDLKEAMRTHKAVFTDFYLSSKDGVPRLSVVAPVLSGEGLDKKAVAAFVLDCDPQQFLYPMIKSWPIPSRTAETLLVRRDGNDVLYLNELRHQVGTAMKLRLPMTQPDLPAAMALKGMKGSVFGHDYRGAAVLASIYSVPATPWCLIAKMDVVEVLAVRRAKSGLILAMTLGFIVATVALALSVWEREKKIQYVALYRAETARHQADEALRILSRRQEALLAAIPEIVMEVDTNKVYVWSNKAGYEFFGEDVIGREASHYFEGEQDTNKTVQPLFDGAADDVIYVESWQRRKDGRKRLLAWWCRTLRDKDGKVVGALSSARDITDNLMMEMRMRQTQKLESIGTLAAGVAHEINDPLMGIMSYAQLMHDALPPDSELAKHAMEINRESERVATIVRNLLSFSRVRKETHNTPAAITDIVDGTLSLTRTIFRHDQINIKVEIPDNIPYVMCRMQEIQQVLMNLLTNARDALNEKYPKHDKDKVIVISAKQFSKDDGKVWVRITVEDHGTGIPEGVREHMFEPFYSTKPHEKGTGLGLSVSYGIVRSYRGEITAESVPGAWTRFHVDIPAGDLFDVREES